MCIPVFSGIREAEPGGRTVRRKPGADRLLVLQGAWTFVCCECCALCGGPIFRQGESYRLCVCVCVCVMRYNSKRLHIQWIGRKSETKKESSKKLQISEYWSQQYWVVFEWIAPIFVLGRFTLEISIRIPAFMKRICVVFLRPFRTCLKGIEIGHGRLILHPSQFMIY